MKKLLAFVVVLSVGTAHAGLLGQLAGTALSSLGNKISTNAMYGSGLSGLTGSTGLMNNNMMNNGMMNTGMMNTGMMNTGMMNTGMMNTGMNNAYGTTGMMNTSNISNILNTMYQQAMLIRQSYPNNANISTYTGNLGNALQMCSQNPAMIINYLPTIMQCIQGLQSMGINVTTLSSGLMNLNSLTSTMNSGAMGYGTTGYGNTNMMNNNMMMNNGLYNMGTGLVNTLARARR